MVLSVVATNIQFGCGLWRLLSESSLAWRNAFAWLSSRMARIQTRSAISLASQVSSYGRPCLMRLAYAPSEIAAGRHQWHARTANGGQRHM